MNTKSCPNCHKNIAEINNFCPICGTSLSDVPVQDIENQFQPKQSDTEPETIQSMNVQESNLSSTVMTVHKKKRKKLIIVITSIVFVAVAILIIGIVKNNTLSYEESNAVIYAREIKNSLKSPNSLKFYSDILYIGGHIDDETHVYYTAKNSFGAEVRRQLVYIDGEQRNLNEDSPEILDRNDFNSDEEWREKRLEQLKEEKKVLNARLLLSNYKLAGADGTGIVECKVISARKILSKL